MIDEAKLLLVALKCCFGTKEKAPERTRELNLFQSAGGRNRAIHIHYDDAKICYFFFLTKSFAIIKRLFPYAGNGEFNLASQFLLLPTPSDRSVVENFGDYELPIAKLASQSQPKSGKYTSICASHFPMHNLLFADYQQIGCFVVQIWYKLSANK